MREVYLQDLLADQASGDAGHSLAITRFPYVIGRHTDCDGRFGSPWISRRHCRFYLTGDEVWPNSGQRPADRGCGRVSAFLSHSG
jgi:pSer/pThr/pTyr-binding forkhead associated (FHA) protein